MGRNEPAFGSVFAGLVGYHVTNQRYPLHYPVAGSVIAFSAHTHPVVTSGAAIEFALRDIVVIVSRQRNIFQRLRIGFGHFFLYQIFHTAQAEPAGIPLVSGRFGLAVVRVYSVTDTLVIILLGI